MSSSLVAPLRQTQRFAVAWRNRTRNRISPVGVLDFDGDFEFQYLSTAPSIEDFRPFVGFPDFSRTYSSPRLFPFFALRVLDKKRPDYGLFVNRLGLRPDASVLDVLARSGGEVKGDSVSLVEQPRELEGGGTSSTFLIRGARFAVRQFDTTEEFARAAPEDALNIVLDEGNEVNRRALLLADRAGAPLGWVPDLLIDYAERVRDAGGQVTVVQNNGIETPWHMRMLVTMALRHDPGPELFTGGPWPARARSTAVH